MNIVLYSCMRGIFLASCSEHTNVLISESRDPVMPYNDVVIMVGLVIFINFRVKRQVIRQSNMDSEHKPKQALGGSLGQ